MAAADDDRRPALTWEYLAHSEVGLVRKNNQDSGLVSDRLLMVADGMGGAAAGDLASAVAVDTFARLAGRHADGAAAEPTGTDSPAEHAGAAADRAETQHRLGEAISDANTRIADLVTTDYTLEGMGTTVTAGVLTDRLITLGHIGDSRGYLFRDGRLEQLTHDHSWVQSLIDEGKISEEEAANHPHRSLLLKVLNGQPANEPDLTSVPAQPGDRLLLCSDGLCGFVEDPDIAEALTGTTREQAMDRLVEAAHRAGGLDNITIILADLAEAGAVDPDTTNVTPKAAAATDAGYLSGPTGSVQLLGSATERDVSAVEASIREHAAERSAEDADDGAEGGGSDDEDRYAPMAPRRPRWRRPLALVLVLVLVLGAGLGAGFAWTRTQYFVGAEQDQVAIFQGLNETVPVLPLSRVYEVQDLRVDELPAYYQGLVRGTIAAGSLDSARETVQQLEHTAEQCRRQQNPPAGSSSSSPKDDPDSTPGNGPGSKQTDRPGSTPQSGPEKTEPPNPDDTPRSDETPRSDQTSPSPTADASAPGQLPPGPGC